MSWDQVWIDVNIATMDPEISAPYGAITDAAIAVKEGKIAWMGPRSELPEFDVLSTPVYRGKGGWLTPGLIDAHTHLVFAGSRIQDVLCDGAHVSGRVFLRNGAEDASARIELAPGGSMRMAFRWERSFRESSTTA